jgi:hypothetical protein
VGADGSPIQERVLDTTRARVSQRMEETGGLSVMSLTAVQRWMEILKPSTIEMEEILKEIEQLEKILSRPAYFLL